MKTISSKNSQGSNISSGTVSVPPDRALARSENGASTGLAEALPDSAKPAEPTEDPVNAAQTQPTGAAPPVRRYRKWLLLAGTVAALAVGGYFLVPWVIRH